MRFELSSASDDPSGLGGRCDRRLVSRGLQEEHTSLTINGSGRFKKERELKKDFVAFLRLANSPVGNTSGPGLSTGLGAASSESC